MRSQLSLSRVLVAAVLMLLIAGGSAFAQEKPAAKTPATSVSWAIQVEPVTTEEGQLPADFAMAIYERLVHEIAKSDKFQQVFRSGDRRAADVPNLLILTTKLEKFSHGSETTRAVTTVGGATQVSVQVQLVTRNADFKVNKRVNGTVRLFGGNLNATQNLAKNIAQVINQSAL